MDIRAVIFDLDCTLTCRRSSLRAASALLRERFSEFLFPGNDEALAESLVMADRFGYRNRGEFFAEVTGSPCWRGSPEMDALLRFWQTDFPTCAVANPESAATLDQLHAQGLRLGLITNGHSLTQNGKIDHLGLRHRFDTVIVSGDVGYKKPDQRIFSHCLDSLGVSAQEAVYVGDHAENDVQGATSAGLHAVWISTGGPWPDNLPMPERQIRSLSELPGLLAGLRVQQ